MQKLHTTESPSATNPIIKWHRIFVLIATDSLANKQMLKTDIQWLFSLTLDETFIMNFCLWCVIMGELKFCFWQAQKSWAGQNGGYHLYGAVKGTEDIYQWYYCCTYFLTVIFFTHEFTGNVFEMSTIFVLPMLLE